MYMFFFLVMQKTAYEMRISDLSSDVCSSYLDADRAVARRRAADPADPCRRGDGHRPRANAAVAYRVDAVADPARCRRLSDPHRAYRRGRARGRESGSAPCRGRVWQYVLDSVVAVALKKKNKTSA